MSTLYESDILEWLDCQIRLLRQLEAGDLNSETPDWANIIGELERLGQRQLHSVQSLMTQALLCLVSAEAWPLSDNVRRWRAEARSCLNDAAQAFTPAMRQRISIEQLYGRALSHIPQLLGSVPPLPISPTCPISLEELIGDTPEALRHVSTSAESWIAQD